jgi:hypothetical protein
MTRALFAGALVISLAVGCTTESGRSVVLVNLTAADTVTGVEEVHAHVVGESGRSIQHAEGGRPPVMLSVSLPKTVRGDFYVQSCGFDAGHELIASSTRVRFSVMPGETVGPLNVELSPDPTASPVCGATGGQGGNGGSGGAGGEGGTTGGEAGGEVGSAGTVGTAGVGGLASAFR